MLCTSATAHRFRSLVGDIKVAAPPKPVELTINATKIGEFFDSLLGNTPPPPGPPVAPPPPPATVPPTPAPAPAPPSIYTVPDVTFSPLPPLKIASEPGSAGRKLLQIPSVAPGLVTVDGNVPVTLNVSLPCHAISSYVTFHAPY